MEDENGRTRYTRHWQRCMRHRSGRNPAVYGRNRPAMRLAGLRPSREPAIADIGCGTGASALLLAGELEAQVTAVDMLPSFLKGLPRRAQEQGVAHRIQTPVCFMTALPFAHESFDVLRAEGAICSKGFASGIRAWCLFLKPGGMLVALEITWLCDAPHSPCGRTGNGNIPKSHGFCRPVQPGRNGYRPPGYFALTEHC